MNEEKKAALLKKYLEQELTNEEEVEFKQLTEQDSEYAEEVEMAIMMNARHNIDKKQHWQQLLEQQHNQADSNETTAKVRHLGRKKLIRIIQAIAAALLVGALGFVIYLNLNSSPDIQSLADKQLTIPYPSPVVTMGSGAQQTQNWKTAIKAYQEKKYALAIPLLEALSLEQPSNGEVHFYLALCYLYNSPKQYQKAIDYFERSSQLDVAYIEKINWYKSLIYLQLGEKQKAQNLINEIIVRKTWHYKDAEQLFEAMN